MLKNQGSLCKRALTAVVAALCSISALSAQPSLAPPQVIDADAPRAKIMLLGTFHFRDAGKDSYQPTNVVDIKSPKRQSQIAELLDLLSEYRPTKVAVEVDRSKQASIDSLYEAYQDGSFELKANEIYQLGFRLANKLGHERVYAIDAPTRYYDPDSSKEIYDQRVAELKRPEFKIDEWNAKFTALYSHDDSLKMTQTLREHFLYINSPERAALGHQHYFVDHFKLVDGKDYFGPDLTTAWFNRNLRILANLIRITDSPDERILLIIGAGHLAVLNSFVEASPEYDLVPVVQYLEE